MYSMSEVMTVYLSVSTMSISIAEVSEQELVSYIKMSANPLALQLN